MNNSIHNDKKSEKQQQPKQKQEKFWLEIQKIMMNMKGWFDFKFFIRTKKTTTTIHHHHQIFIIFIKTSSYLIHISIYGVCVNSQG